MKKKTRRPRLKPIATEIHMLIAAMIGLTLEGIIQIEGVAFTTFVVYPVLLMVNRSRK